MGLKTTNSENCSNLKGKVTKVSKTMVNRCLEKCQSKDSLRFEGKSGHKMWVWLVLGSVFLLGSLPSGCQGHPVFSGGDQGRQGLRNIIYCTLLKHGQLVKGESKPPILSHVRVSRGPEDFNPGEAPNLDDDDEDITETRSIKSPSYQHKMMNRLSQFHSPPSHQYSSDVTYSLQSNPRSIYPVASVQAMGQGNGGSGNYAGLGPFFHQSSPNWREYQELDDYQGDGGAGDPNDPTFTPYIGSRILANIPKFFQHLHENIKAIHDSKEALSDESSSISVEHGHHPNSYDSLEEKQMDMPSRRGDYFQSLDGRLSVDTGGAGGGYRYSHKDDGQHGGEYATKEFINYMGRDPKYKKANNYNPSWLFTNLGLGKRSGHNKPHQQHRLVQRN